MWLWTGPVLCLQFCFNICTNFYIQGQLDWWVLCFPDYTITLGWSLSSWAFLWELSKMGIEDISSVISDYLFHLFVGWFLFFFNYLKYKSRSGGISLCFCSFVERRNFHSANIYFLSATNLLLFRCLSRQKNMVLDIAVLLAGGSLTAYHRSWSTGVWYYDNLLNSSIPLGLECCSILRWQQQDWSFPSCWVSFCLTVVP